MLLKRFISIFLSVLYLSNNSYAQTSKLNRDELAEKLIYLMNDRYDLGEQECPIDEIVEDLLIITTSPFNINRADRKKISELVFLTDYQIESLLLYLSESGAVRSFTELGLINGFDDKIAHILSYFIILEDTIDDNSSLRNNLFIKFSTPLVYDLNYIGSSFSQQLRYNFDYKNKFSGGFIQDKDIGERYFDGKSILPGDFLSAFLAYNDIKIANKIAVNLYCGDFTANFGQGLVLWKGGNFNGNFIGGLKKRKRVISRYFSANENDFFRGIAANISNVRGINDLAEVDLCVFVSYKGIDASIKDGKYTSILSGGLHNTASSLEKKKSMMEIVFGTRVGVSFNKIDFGFNWIGYEYSKENGRILKDYNRFQQYYGMWGNFSFDFNMFLKGINLYGEGAFDYGGSSAFLLGANCNLGKFGLEILIRDYSKSYISTHAGAYSRQNGCYNQQGIVFNAEYYKNRNIKFFSLFDYTFFPWVRYGMNSSSSMLKVSLGADFKFDNVMFNFSSGLSYSSFANNYKLNFKGSAEYKISSGMFVTSRISMKGGLGNKVVSIGQSFEGGVKLFKERISLFLGCGYYNCMDWNQRIYLYERGIPNSYSMRLLYGNGLWCYYMIKSSLIKRLDFYLKQDMLLKKKESIEKNSSMLSFAIKYIL